MILKKDSLYKQIKNFTINFGPQHPAAHEVLRFFLEKAKTFFKGFQSSFSQICLVFVISFAVKQFFDPSVELLFINLFLTCLIMFGMGSNFVKRLETVLLNRSIFHYIIREGLRAESLFFGSFFQRCFMGFFLGFGIIVPIFFLKGAISLMGWFFYFFAVLYYRFRMTVLVLDAVCPETPELHIREVPGEQIARFFCSSHYTIPKGLFLSSIYSKEKFRMGRFTPFPKRGFMSKKALETFFIENWKKLGSTLGVGTVVGVEVHRENDIALKNKNFHDENQKVREEGRNLLSKPAVQEDPDLLHQAKAIEASCDRLEKLILFWDRPGFRALGYVKARPEINANFGRSGALQAQVTKTEMAKAAAEEQNRLAMQLYKTDVEGRIAWNNGWGGAIFGKRSIPAYGEFEKPLFFDSSAKLVMSPKPTEFTSGSVSDMAKYAEKLEHTKKMAPSHNLIKKGLSAKDLCDGGKGKDVVPSIKEETFVDWVSPIFSYFF